MFLLRWTKNKTLLTNKEKIFILRKLGIKIGQDVQIAKSVEIANTNLLIGNHVFINSGVCLNGGLSGRIIINDNIQIGPNTLILAVNHQMGKRSKRAGSVTYDQTTIDEGCWIGGNVTILSGVHIASGCVIGAGAVVIEDTLPDGLYVGVPALRKKSLN